MAAKICKSIIKNYFQNFSNRFHTETGKYFFPRSNEAEFSCLTLTLVILRTYRQEVTVLMKHPTNTGVS